ncbi:hypothetical protein ACQJBY_003601 [Aegilops geniculata]
MEELDEFEVLWPEYYAGHAHADDEQYKTPTAAASAQGTATSWQRRAARSRPVDVPPTPSRAAVLLLRWKDGTDQDELVEKDGGGKLIVPPHLLVSGRRLSDGEAAAAYTLLRAGRQGKRARDLRHLRNSVLRMTGFIEG